MPLPKLEKNKIYIAIERIRLEPTEFRMQEDQNWLALTHENSGSEFKFFWRAHEFEVRVTKIIYDVVDGGHYDRAPYDKTYSMNETADLVTRWADEIKQTAEAPDLRANLEPSKDLIADIQNGDSNAAFTVDEQRLIALQLQEIKSQLKEQFELTSGQFEQIEKELDEAAEASKRMGRKDWFIYFIGLISTLAIATTVAPGVGEHVFTVFMHALGYLFTGESGPPEIMA